MPKENTHLWFAHDLLDYLPEASMRGDISQGIDEYHLGSFIPDTFFYGRDPSIENISEVIHGKDGAPTNTMILSVLDEARTQRDITFILGYISHCALDIVFHPVINALSGNYYDDDPVEREKAVYLHRHIETCIDIEIKDPLRIYALVRRNTIKGLVFEDIVSRNFSVPVGMIRSTLAKQLLLNRLFASIPAYKAVSLIHRLGVTKKREFLSLFYGNALDEGPALHDPMRYRASGAGPELVVSLAELFARAREKALRMIEAAYGYSKGTVSKERLIEEIPGENLGTGEIPGSSLPV
ncbi:MAG TPA: zinc dependent phospholipase C family protein [Deltaproteobacteria bacterium]|nr:zinc dependent phospholipase C family protein [Deltaproteobacteria bacterium]HQI00538.1 zinc dependent phospholipase C family protein [Deltaproteobacteria bacterium]